MARFKQINDIDVGDDFVLPEGNVVRGQLLFKKHCAQCHTIRRDGSNPYGTLAGPNLYGVMGRTAAMNQRTGWVKYSSGLEASGILWTERNMMAFLKNPRAFAGGAINMNFRGIESWQDRVDIIHYLQRAGHESWMVQDGTPHSQRKWWTRGEKGGPTKNYWEVNATQKQLSPWQHVWRAAQKKVDEGKQSAKQMLGFADEKEEADLNSADPEIEDNREGQTWQKIKGVEDGVKPASMQRSFNWPPLEVIQEGPVRRKKVEVTPVPSKEAVFPVTVASCQEQAPTSGLANGVRLPSGLVAYPDHGGPAAPPPPQSRAAAAPPPPPPATGPPAKAFEGKRLPDGGVLTPGGMIAYAC